MRLKAELECLPQEYKDRGSLFLATKAAELTRKKNKIIKENPDIQAVYNRSELSTKQKNEILKYEAKKLDATIKENNNDVRRLNKCIKDNKTKEVKYEAFNK